MASLSSHKSCLHCGDSSSNSLRNGWDLTNGNFAQLCDRCFSIYESGRFCEKFHKNQPDWRNCKSCGKPIHCSCLVSFSQWLLLEGGCRVVCIECSKVNSFLARNFSNVKDVTEEMKKFRICRRSKGAIAPLFEVLITAGTTSNKSGSITVPNKYAEAYFPEVTDAQGITLEFIYDDGVNEWSLSVCSDLDKTYVLDGLEEYMSSYNLQEGDTLEFSLMVPEGPYVVGFRKASTKKPSRKASGRRRK